MIHIGDVAVGNTGVVGGLPSCQPWQRFSTTNTQGVTANTCVTDFASIIDTPTRIGEKICSGCGIVASILIYGVAAYVVYSSVTDGKR